MDFVIPTKKYHKTLNPKPYTLQDKTLKFPRHFDPTTQNIKP
jgi:hypothetical protein